MKFLSINKNQAAVLTTLLILVSLGAAYFFIYLPHNERQIQAQRFNALQNIDRNIHTKIENSIGLLNNLLSGYQAGDEAGKAKLAKYIRDYPSTNFKLAVPAVIPTIQRRLLPDSLGTDSVYSIRVNNDTRDISLYFFKQEVDEKNDTTAYKIGMNFSFKQFIAFLLPKDVFDEYIVFSKGRPVYESFPAGISFVKEDSLLSTKAGFGAAGVKNQVISGTAYKMFLQPVGFDANNEWVIGGLLSTSHYENEKTQLPTQMILLLVTIMLIGMVAFPWLKLYQMGSKDRLTISDGIASIFISMLLVSLIFFVFFNYNMPFRPDNKDAKLSLANGIDKAFKSEIDTAYNRLQQCDRLVSLPRKDIVNLGRQTITYAHGTDPVENIEQVQAATRGLNVKQVYWLNKSGDEIINWTTDNINAPHGNFKSRAYFRRIDEQREYMADGNKDHRFFLDQVVSWTSATFRSVISMRSKLSSKDSIVVVALSVNFKSLDKIVLPTGYLFAITDNTGDVLYHSESSRNLNENLLNVFSKADNLKSCLESKASGAFSTKYWGKDYEVQVKPINGLPYFIVIFEDSTYGETREMEIYSFTFFMLFFFFGLLVLQLFAIFLVSAKRSFFKKQVLDTSWIGPKISGHQEYVLSSVFNGGIILLLLLFFKNSSFLGYIFMLLLSVTGIPLFLNSVFARKYFHRKNNALQFKVLAKYCLWGFVVLTLIIAMKVLDGANLTWLAVYGVLMIALGVGVYAIKERLFSIAIRLKQSPRLKLLLGNWNYVHSFAVMAFTRLMITSGLPIIFFYISSYNYEQNLDLRYRQIDFANRLLNKFPAISPDSILNSNTTWNGVYYDSTMIKPVTVVAKQTALANMASAAYSPEELRTLQLLNLFRVYMTDNAVTEDRFYKPGPSDSSFLFNPLLKEACAKGTGTITYRQSSLPQQYLRLQSENLNYQYPSIFRGNKFNGAIFWVLFGSMLLIFYFIIRNIIKKLFALNLPELEVWRKLDDKILINKNWDQPLFVIGLPGSGKKKYLLDKINKQEMIVDGISLCYNNADETKNNVFIAELINIPSAGNETEEKLLWNEYTKKVFDPKNKIIVVNHFEYNIQDSVSNRYKLEFLERLYLENKCRIVILSTIHPVAFLDSAMDQPYKPDEKSTPGQDLERWHVLLGHYRIIVLPLQLPSVDAAPTMLYGKISRADNGRGVPDASIRIRDSSVHTYTRPDGKFILPDHPLPFIIDIYLEGYFDQEVAVTEGSDLHDITLRQAPNFRSAQLTRQETNHTYFLRKLQAPAFEAGRELTEQTRMAKFDELAFKFQVSSHYFYMYIWQSLTKEEKFLLYDLAEDNLVNAFDDYNLSMLLAKGIVIRPDGTLKLFNKSFRNFILTAIGNSEAIKIKNRIKENGNWNTLKNPLQLVILAILAFLLTSQEEAFAKLITYVAALGAGVPAVLKLFSMFDKSSQKQE